MKKIDMRQRNAQLGNGAHALATQILGNSDDAADAVHDAVVKVLGKPASYDAGSGPFTPWSLRVVRNRCIYMIRRRRPSGADVGELADNGPGPEDSLEISQRDLGLQLALARLSSEQRQIIVLRDYMGLAMRKSRGYWRLHPERSCHACTGRQRHCRHAIHHFGHRWRRC